MKDFFAKLYCSVFITILFASFSTISSAVADQEKRPCPIGTCDHINSWRIYIDGSSPSPNDRFHNVGNCPTCGGSASKTYHFRNLPPNERVSMGVVASFIVIGGSTDGYSLGDPLLPNDENYYDVVGLLRACNNETEELYSFHFLFAGTTPNPLDSTGQDYDPVFRVTESVHTRSNADGTCDLTIVPKKIFTKGETDVARRNMTAIRHIDGYTSDNDKTDRSYVYTYRETKW